MRKQICILSFFFWQLPLFGVCFESYILLHNSIALSFTCISWAFIWSRKAGQATISSVRTVDITFYNILWLHWLSTTVVRHKLAKAAVLHSWLNSLLKWNSPRTIYIMFIAATQTLVSVQLARVSSNLGQIFIRIFKNLYKTTRHVFPSHGLFADKTLCVINQCT